MNAYQEIIVIKVKIEVRINILMRFSSHVCIDIYVFSDGGKE